tara:strand:- start:3608 stop:3817 length:210 start_codon:yes stop_codon:yes gene_type:complete
MVEILDVKITVKSIRRLKGEFFKKSTLPRNTQVSRVYPYESVLKILLIEVTTRFLATAPTIPKNTENTC